MTPTIYGIKTCDTMKKAFAWLDGHGIGYRFHDYRADGLDRDTLTRWVDAVGWEKLLNKSSMTFRALPDQTKTALDAEKAIGLMLDQPTMIKRPVLDIGTSIEVGFKPQRYEALFPR